MKRESRSAWSPTCLSSSPRGFHLADIIFGRFGSKADLFSAAVRRGPAFISKPLLLIFRSACSRLRWKRLLERRGYIRADRVPLVSRPRSRIPDTDASLAQFIRETGHVTVTN